MDAMAFLEKSAKLKRQPVFVLSGDEDFLKRRCREAIVAGLLGDADAEFAVSVYAAEKLDVTTVRNELDTLPFLAPLRIVVVENADPFVAEHRAALEKYAANPSKVGVLVLEVKTFPETTKLAKALPDAAKVSCKSPSPYRLDEAHSWCVAWCQSRHGRKLTADAAAALVERVGTQLGLLDQELGKLAVAVGERKQITPADVEAFVGRSRAANVFRILDAVGEGKPGEAFGILAELFEEGEAALAVLGPLTAQLRKLGTVGRLLALGQSLGPAMDAANVPKWLQARQSVERQVRHLGRRRLLAIADWLVEANLGLKGGSPLPDRLQLELLLVKLARPLPGK
jgi:DNA polymerase-3 subunit delta